MLHKYSSCSENKLWIKKRLKFKNNIVTPENELTQLEELYVKLNLSKRIAHHESGVF